jgi:glycosyltransferase involved in cell wall biosynthesis
MRIAYLTSHPIQYQAPLFRALAAHPDVTFRAYFASRLGLSGEVDAGFGTSVKWDLPLLDGYEHEFLWSPIKTSSTGSFLGLINPDAPLRIKAFDPDVVIVHGYSHFTTVWMDVVGSLLGLPILVRGDTHLLASRPTWKKTLKAVLLRTLARTWRGALAVGTLNAEYWRAYGVPADRIFMAPYAIDNERFMAAEGAATETASVWRAEFGIPTGAPVVGFVGKLMELKAPQVLIEAFARAGVDDAHLVLTGAGPLEKRLKTLVAEMRLEARVHFRGFVNQLEIPAAYAIADVVALPSRLEAWGLAVNEAMCLSRPVIVSDQVGCAPDLVSPATGWVFPVDNVGALAACIRDAFHDRDRLRAMGTAARNLISNRGLTACVDAIVSATRVIASRSAGHRNA